MSPAREPAPAQVSALLAAAGGGERLGGKPKAFLQAGGCTLLERAVALLAPSCAQILVGVRPEDVAAARKLLGSSAEVLAGGATRQATLANLLGAARLEFVLLHEVARPFATANLLREVLRVATQYGAAAPALPVQTGDSLALRDGEWLGAPLPRDRVIATQTPYACRRELLAQAYARAQAEGWNETSTTTLLTRAGVPVRLIPGDPTNWKITYTADWERARSLLEAGP